MPCICVFSSLKYVELKEAEEKSWKESERLEKEIAEVQELKVIESNVQIFKLYKIEKSLTLLFVFTEKYQYHDSR